MKGKEKILLKLTVIVVHIKRDERTKKKENDTEEWKSHSYTMGDGVQAHGLRK